ncbi:alpha/beta hydrolase [Aquibacillus sediminis]|uniref:alpha/beta hydrolase n=1 Tax=Aquibacillus sediminis TaxID=2574734 RepID=UPI0014870232|nr:alpha/beta hydrolase [Aquibacillus sediminis]
MNFSNIPSLKDFQAKDGDVLSYRYYPATSNSDTVMIMLHGICEDSKYLMPLAQFVSEHGLAHVYTPDLRGYGEKAVGRGDISYIGQLEDDLVDFMEVVKQKHASNARIILAGHSAGGGTALRFAASKHSKLVDHYLLLAPFVHFQAPIMKDSDATTANKGRLIWLMILNRLGIKTKNHLPVLASNKPEEKRHGSETLSLSYRLFMSRLPDNYKKALISVPDDTLVLIGSEDEVFKSEAFSPLFSKYTNAEVQVIKNIDHDGILSSEEAFNLIEDWLHKVVKVSN